MNNEITTATHASPFDTIKRTRKDGTEYWSARDMQSLMGYTEWRKFEGSIERAIESAKNQGMPIRNHFVGAANMVKLGSGAEREVKDYELSRYAGYLVSLNGDPRKSEVAAAQAYFVMNTIENESRKAGEAKTIATLTKHEEASQEIEMFSTLAKAFPLTADWAQRQAVATAKKASGQTSELEASERLITAQTFLLENGYKRKGVEGKKRPMFYNEEAGHLISESVFGREVASIYREELNEEPNERIDEATGRHMKFYKHGTHRYIFEKALKNIRTRALNK